MRQRIARYLETWKARGYPDDIPDEVPAGLMQRNLAPSYKAIAFAILKNDVSCRSLGFTPQPSPWYVALKRLERDARKEAACSGASSASPPTTPECSD
jgi:predicted phosphoadenosine phosphosulfate sulfurtransferase